MPNLMNIIKPVHPQFLSTLGIVTGCCENIKGPFKIIEIKHCNILKGIIVTFTAPFPDEGKDGLNYQLNYKLNLRKKLDLPLFPKVLDYKIKLNEVYAKVDVLMSPIGTYLSEIDKENTEKSKLKIIKCFSYIIQSLNKFKDLGIIMNIVNLNNVFMNENSVIILDLEDVILRSSWCSNDFMFHDISQFKCNSILLPKTYMKQENSITSYYKIQTHVSALHFFGLLTKIDLISKLDNIVKQDTDVGKNIEKIVEKEKESFLANHDREYLRKFLTILSSCITGTPKTCPKLKILADIFKEFNNLNFNMIKKKLSNQCRTCGEELGKMFIPIPCTKKKLCETCVMNHKCTMCAKNLILGDTKGFCIDLEENKNILKLYPSKYKYTIGSLGDVSIVHKKDEDKIKDCLVIEWKNDGFYIYSEMEDIDIWITISTSAALQKKMEFMIADYNFFVKNIKEKSIKLSEGKYAKIFQKDFFIGSGMKINAQQYKLPDNCAKIVIRESDKVDLQVLLNYPPYYFLIKLGLK